MKNSLLPPPLRQNKKNPEAKTTTKTAVVRSVHVLILVGGLLDAFLLRCRGSFCSDFPGSFVVFNLDLPKISGAGLLMLTNGAVFPFHGACSIAFILANCQNTIKEAKAPETHVPALYQAILCTVEFSTVLKNCEFASAKS